MDGVVHLDWSENPRVVASTFELNRRINNEEFQFLDTVSTTTFTDDDTNPSANRYDYSILYTDGCGNQSEGNNIARPVRLIVDEITTNTLILRWNELGGWSNGIDRYVVEELDASAAVIGTNDNAGRNTFEVDLTARNQQLYLFRIRTVPSNVNLSDAFSNILEIYVPAQVFIPTAIAPEGSQAANRSLQVNGIFIDEYELNVFNRWGELIHFSKTGEAGWDGTNNNGEAAQTGVYVYRINFTDLNGVEYTESGSVTLIR
jgi:gliding motility-associated-like protein